MTYTAFFRVLEADDKAAALFAAAQGPGSTRFEVSCDAFSKVPGSPFAYWVVKRLLSVFGEQSAKPQYLTRQGMITCDDFRFFRLAVEARVQSVRSLRWRILAKGGAFGQYYADPPLVVTWGSSQPELEAFGEIKGNAPRSRQSSEHYFRPGLTWPRRTDGLSFRFLPAGSIFADKGPSAFVDGDSREKLKAVCAVFNSAPFGALVALQLARTELAQSYEVGLVQQTPVPELNLAVETVLAELAQRAWSIRRDLDTATEVSHAFAIPALLQAAEPTLQALATLRVNRVFGSAQQLVDINSAINDICFKLYGIEAEDRRSIERGFGGTSAEGKDEDESDDDAEEADAIPLDPAPLTAQLLSWTLGVSLGRFDLRLATGERPLPPEPDPFDPLPACSPGMLTGDDGLPLASPPPGYPIPFPIDGILVDDPGHDRDLLTRIHQVFTVLFADHADDRLQEAVSILDPSAQSLRPWLRRTFFEEHIQRYSKSRRKAPIYWRLGTPSGSYSVWIYLHRFNKDTLHRVLNDHVAPKLRYESSKLAALQSEGGPSPSPSQRRALADQETFVDELRALQDELDRVAPLWDPDLDDGVVINASFLHRLFAHTRAWQRECESHWQKLQKGEYDWAHLAMRLWPERVVPKCTEDRSLAIAHGLEDALWLEGTDGKWRPQPVTDEQIAALVQERTSTAVKDALRRMGETPEPVAARKVRAAAPAGEPKPPKKAKVVKVPEGVQLGLGLGSDPTATELNAVRAALHAADDGLPKAELLAACGLDEDAGAAALAALVQTGEVVKIGAGRGTRYRLGGGR